VWAIAALAMMERGATMVVCVEPTAATTSSDSDVP
jgi:hypothetical protein